MCICLPINNPNALAYFWARESAAAHRQHDAEICLHALVEPEPPLPNESALELRNGANTLAERSQNFADAETAPANRGPHDHSPTDRKRSLFEHPVHAPIAASPPTAHPPP